MGSKVDAKVVLLGKEFSGKTSLVERYLHQRFNDSVPYQNTIGAAFGAKKVTDTAGSERYEAMSRIYYRGAKAAVLCYDLTEKSSFERAKYWVNELKTYEDGCRIYLCGTKYDMVQNDKKLRQVDYHSATDYADEINAKVFETSSKTGHNVEELFFELAQDYSKEESEFVDGEVPTLELTEHSQPGRMTCCGIKL
ncbi:hypothetical protein pdam_00019520 [Pocillopora damicornis]|uniref:Ras-related protein Rab-24 n=1 Tax=Pocillopora damicornis TaxID=46731 RepID=A0A3M6TSG1_POCDA|nr:hypothetical protein pdam_00019520 [Pocillopora damicornis]